MQESLEKKWELSYLYDMTQQALESGDIDQAVELSKKGLRKSELDSNIEWKNKFEEISRALTEQSSDFPIKNDAILEKILYEDLTKVNGVSPTHKRKLWDAGYTTINKIAFSTPKILSRVRGIGIETANKFILSAREYLGLKNDYEAINTPQLKLNIKTVKEVKNEEQSESALVSQDIKSKSTEENDQFSYQERFLKAEVAQKEQIETIEEDNATIEDEVFIEKELSKKKVKHIRSIFELPHESDIIEVEKLHDQEKYPKMQDLEKHAKEEPITIYDQIIKEVGSEGFYSVPTQIIQETFLQEIDLLFFKMYLFKPEQQILLITPIKIAEIEDILLISEDIIEYQQEAEHNFLIKSYMSHLIHAQEIISEEMAINGNFFQYIQNFLMTKIDMVQDQVVKNESTLFSAREIISVYCDPILISNNEVKYVEKSIPFAYQRTNNIHYISTSQITDLLEFLEQKHGYIEEYNDAKQTEDTYQHTNQEFQKKLMYYSLIPAGFGGLTIMIALTQIPTLLLPFIGLSYTMLGVYGIMVGYLFYKFKNMRKDLRNQFAIPSYQKPVELDDASLEIIYRGLVDELMLQFGYECFGKTSEYSLLNQIEAHRTKKLLNTPIENSSNTLIENLFESNKNKDTYHEKLDEYLAK